MTGWRIALSRLVASFRRGRLDQELRRELASHLEEAAEEYRRQGMSPAEAASAARRRLGGVAQIEEVYRDHRSLRWLDDLGGDLRQAMRSLWHSPAFSLTVLLVTAIGIGTITAIFALLHAVILRPLPYADPDRLVTITHTGPGLRGGTVGLSSGLQDYYRQRASSFEAIGAYRDNQPQSLRTPDRGAERVEVALASEALLRILGVQPVLGRLFSEEDARPGAENRSGPVPVLISHAFWQERFGGDRAIVGRTLTLGDRPRRVVGVLPEVFRFPDSDTQIWMLWDPANDRPDFAQWFGFNGVARLRSGVTVASATAEVTAILPGIVGRYPDATPARFDELRLAPVLTPLAQALVAHVTTPLWTLFGGMTLLLLIACANVAGLFLVRMAARRREIAVRLALGAHRFRILRMLLVEALVLMGLSAAAGLGLAQGLLRVIMARVPIDLPRSAEVALDAGAVWFAAGVALVLGCLHAGLAGLRRHEAPVTSLVSGGYSVTGRRRGRWGREPFIVVQVALALVLLVGSSLLVRTWWNLSRQPLGFTPGRLATVDVALAYRAASQHAPIYRAMLDRVRSVPGVTAVSAASFAPLTGSADRYPVDSGGTPAVFKFVMPGYFRVMGTRILEGATFDEGQVPTGERPVLISRALARRLYPDGRALGQPVRRLREDGGVDRRDGVPTPPFTVAGIVDDVRETSLRGAPSEVVYIPVMDPLVERGLMPTDMMVVVRSDHPSAAMIAGVRHAITDAEPALTVDRVRTMDAIVQHARGTEVFVGAFLLFAAAISLLLGMVGVYGSVAQVVQRRTREIGIRVALGASRSDVLRAVVGGSLRSVLIGLGLGVAVALAVTRVLGALLFDVSAYDPLAYLAAAACLLLAAGGAGLFAARTGIRIQPTEALRNQG